MEDAKPRVGVTPLNQMARKSWLRLPEAATPSTLDKEGSKQVDGPPTAALTAEGLSSTGSAGPGGWLRRLRGELSPGNGVAINLPAALDASPSVLGPLDGWEEEDDVGHAEMDALRPPSPSGSVSAWENTGDDDSRLKAAGTFIGIFSKPPALPSSAASSDPLSLSWDALRALPAPATPGNGIGGGGFGGSGGYQLYGGCGGCGRIAGVTSVPPLDASPRLVWGNICGCAEPPLPPLRGPAADGGGGGGPFSARGNSAAAPFAATPTGTGSSTAGNTPGSTRLSAGGGNGGSGPELWPPSLDPAATAATSGAGGGVAEQDDFHAPPHAPTLFAQTSRPWEEEGYSEEEHALAVSAVVPELQLQLGLAGNDSIAPALSWDKVLAPEPPARPPPLTAGFEPAPWAGNGDDETDSSYTDAATAERAETTAAAGKTGSGGGSGRVAKPSIDTAAQNNGYNIYEGDNGGNVLSWGEIVALTPSAAPPAAFGPWEGAEPIAEIADAAAAVSTAGGAASASGNEQVAVSGAVVSLSVTGEAAAAAEVGAAMSVEADEATAVTAEEDEGYLKLRARLQPYLRARALMAGWGQTPRPAPLLLPRHAGRRLAVCVDLEGTLLHCQPEPLDSPDFVVEFCLGAPALPPPPPSALPESPTAAAAVAAAAAGATVKVWGRWRPHLQEFLRAVAAEHELFVFTAAARPFAEAVAAAMDPEGLLLSGVLCREQCASAEDGSRVKDLEVLGRDLGEVVMIDTAFGFHLDNVIPVTRWTGAIAAPALEVALELEVKNREDSAPPPEDSELPRALEQLRALSGAENVRTPLREAFQVRRLVETSNELLAARLRGEFPVEAEARAEN